MKQGLYEQVINQLVANQLMELDAAAFEVGTEKLDVEEARKLLKLDERGEVLNLCLFRGQPILSKGSV